MGTNTTELTLLSAGPIHVTVPPEHDQPLTGLSCPVLHVCCLLWRQTIVAALWPTGDHLQDSIYLSTLNTVFILLLAIVFTPAWLLGMNMFGKPLSPCAEKSPFCENVRSNASRVFQSFPHEGYAYILFILLVTFMTDLFFSHGIVKCIYGG